MESLVFDRPIGARFQGYRVHHRIRKLVCVTQPGYLFELIPQIAHQFVMDERVGRPLFASHVRFITRPEYGEVTVWIVDRKIVRLAMCRR